MELSDQLAVGRPWHHPDGEHHQVGLDRDVVTQHAVGDVNLQLSVGLDLLDFTAGHHPRRLPLGGEEEVLHVAGSANVLVDHRVFD